MEEKLLAQLEEKDEWIDQLERSLAGTESELKVLYERVEDLEWMLGEMNSSPAYKVAKHLSLVGRLIAPAGTGRRRFLQLGWRGLRAVPKLRSRHWVAHKVRTALNRSRGNLGLVLRPCRIMVERFVGPVLQAQTIELRSPTVPDLA